MEKYLFPDILLNCNEKGGKGNMLEMRRVDRLMKEEDAFALLEKGEYGILATVDREGWPYGTPVNYVVADKHIYFHGTASGGSKYDNIMRDGRVCFTVVGKTEVTPEKFGTLFESVIAFGEASLVSDEEERLAVFREFLKKYSSEFLTEGEKYIKAMGPKAMIVKIAIKSLTGKQKQRS
ncbi:MAG: pyridoxamine 5'-phosphate oxidase family protein [Spirochaetaceae bacterium]|nr:pyridoxamine 5'-phosphate oxidase family protein [Spirochaetaceae bacterium]